MRKIDIPKDGSYDSDWIGNPCCEHQGEQEKYLMSRTENDYIAWVHYNNGSISTCDSDAKGAFKVYRRGQLKEIREKFAKSQPIEALFFEQWLKEIGESTI